MTAARAAVAFAKEQQMRKGLFGRKLGMTQIFQDDGTRIPVTIIEAEPNVVVAVRTPDADGYSAVQLGVGDAKEKHLTKPQLGHLKKAGVPPKRHLQEVRLDPADLEGVNVGDTFGIDLFEAGMRVDVTGVTIGRGFQGVMKRHHMAGMRATHGTHEARRNPGSIGNRKTPGRTFPNKRLPGHMGDVQVTTQNLTIAEIIPDQNLILVKGSIPGARGGRVLIRGAVKGQPKGQ